MKKEGKEAGPSCQIGQISKLRGREEKAVAKTKLTGLLRKEDFTERAGIDRKESRVLRLRLAPAEGSKLGKEGKGSKGSYGSDRSDRSVDKNSAVMRVARKLERRREELQGPKVGSFEDFLLKQARVKCGSEYAPYHFKGREALKPIVERLDQILAAGEPDVSLALCGGAQFGKTVLMLNLLAYLRVWGHMRGWP